MGLARGRRCRENCRSKRAISRELRGEPVRLPGEGEQSEKKQSLVFRRSCGLVHGLRTLDPNELHLRSRRGRSAFRCRPRPARLRCTASFSIASAIVGWFTTGSPAGDVQISSEAPKRKTIPRHCSSCNCRKEAAPP